MGSASGESVPPEAEAEAGQVSVGRRRVRRTERRRIRGWLGWARGIPGRRQRNRQRAPGDVAGSFGKRNRGLAEHRQQRVEGALHRGKPLRGISRGAAREPLIETAGQSNAVLPSALRGSGIVAGEDLAQQRRQRLPRLPVRAADQAVEGHQPERPDVRGGCGSLVFELLRRHPSWRSDGRRGVAVCLDVLRQLRDPEVQQLDRERNALSARIGHEDVRRLEIPVHQTGLMCQRQPVAELLQDLRDLRRAQAPRILDSRLERFPVQILHRQPGHTTGFVDPGGHHVHDVIRLQARRRARLQRETLAHARVHHPMWLQDLERALAPCAELHRKKDGAHSASPQRPDDLIVPREHVARPKHLSHPASTLS